MLVILQSNDIVRGSDSQEDVRVRYPCRQTLGALVIVLMALSSVAPLGYTHTHEATSCREHAHERGAGHTHDHPHCHRHCHATVHEAALPAMQAPHTHRHVFWWGLEFVLPEAISPTGEPASDVGEAELHAICGAAAEVVVDLTPSPRLLPPAVCLNAGASALQATSVEQVVAQRAESNLLCDAARHLRSGVQLL